LRRGARATCARGLGVLSRSANRSLSSLAQPRWRRALKEVEDGARNAFAIDEGVAGQGEHFLGGAPRDGYIRLAVEIRSDRRLITEQGGVVDSAVDAVPVEMLAQRVPHIGWD